MYLPKALIRGSTLLDEERERRVNVIVIQRADERKPTLKVPMLRPMLLADVHFVRLACPTEGTSEDAFILSLVDPDPTETVHISLSPETVGNLTDYFRSIFEPGARDETAAPRVKVEARYPSKASKHVALAGNVEGLEPIFANDCFLTDAENEILKLGAQLGDLIGHLIHRRGSFNVIIPRELKDRVGLAAIKVGRDFEVWDCGDDEDPKGEWARAEFASR